MIDTEVYTVFVFFCGLCPKIIEVHSCFILNAYFQTSTTADAISSLFPQLGARLSEPDQFSSVSAESKSYPFKVVGTKSVVVTYLFFFSQQKLVEDYCLFFHDIQRCRCFCNTLSKSNAISMQSAQ